MRTIQLARREAVPPDLRVKKALQEKRFAEAVQLALDLPDRPELLYEAVVGRVAAWRESGQTNFAADLLRKVAPRLSGDPARAQHLACALASCGAVPEALMMAPDPAPVRVAAADAAMERGSTGQSILPDEMQVSHDAVLRAFAAFHGGKDEEARELLQQIGLGSPFLDWKLLLRGLMAWHAGDDAKALDNWQRLDAQRLPAQLSAPLRANLDPAWLHRQTPEQQARLRRRMDRLLAAPLVAELRSVQREMETGPPASAIRRVVAMMPHLKVQYPDHVPRLVEAMSFAIMVHGDDRDVNLLVKEMPAPSDDPTWDRLRALRAEHAGDIAVAHRHWLQYEQVLATRPELFAADSERARALVWWHIGRLGHIPKPRGFGSFGFLNLPKDPARKPSAKQCQAKALKLAPDLKVVLLSALLDAVDNDKFDPIIKAGERLLKQHPGDEETLELLASTCDRHGRQMDHFAYAKQLVARRPLDAHAREEAARAGRRMARFCVLCRHPAGARAAANEALALDPTNSIRVLPFLALLDRADGNGSAIDALLEQANTAHRGVIAVRLLAENKPFGNDKAMKARLGPVIKESLNGNVSMPVITMFASAFADMNDEVLDYPGAKSDAAKVGRKLVEAANRGEGSAEDLDAALVAAIAAEMWTAVVTAATQARARFPDDPRFPLHSAMARFERSAFADEVWLPRDLDLAEQLLAALPLERRPAHVADDIADLRRQIHDEIGGQSLPELFRRFADAVNEEYKP